jgi:hypothetical protein
LTAFVDVLRWARREPDRTVKKHPFLPALTVLIALAAPVSPAQSSREASAGELPSISFIPGIEMPIETDKRLFEPIGGTGSLSLLVPVAPLPFLSALADVGYTFAPVRAETSLSLLSVGVGADLGFEATPQLIVHGNAVAGGFFGLFNAALVDPTGALYDPQSGFGFYASAGAGVTFYITPLFSLDLSGAYYRYAGLSQGMRVRLGTALHLSGLSRRLDLRDPVFQDVFPSLLQSYRETPVGNAVLRNGERFPLKNVQVSLLVNGFMDGPRTGATIAQLKPGESRAVDLYALFPDRILESREDTQATAAITVSYILNGRKQQKVVNGRVTVHNRNASTWDDDRKIASFMSTKDPDVLRFSKAVAEAVGSDNHPSIDRNLRMGMAMFEAVSQFGVSYVVDPNTPTYEASSSNPRAVDFLQYPNQTLKYKGGDCDDLSILLTSLLESIGVETAVITIPGHIYMAFALDMTDAEARKTFQTGDELVIRGGKAWIPLEITMLGGTFLSAWRTGASEWNQNGDNARFSPTHEAWKTFASAGTPGDVGAIADLDGPASAKRYEATLAAFIDRELAPQVERLQLALRSSPDSRTLNKLGILYARYGKNAEAEEMFQRILDQETYVPALINMGNLAILRGDHPKATSFFEAARAVSPDSPQVITGLARASYGEGKLAAANQYIAALKKKDPTAAERLAYMNASDQGGRASEAAQAGRNMEWTEED